ncbi:MAG: radical SAM protein, partial [Nanoarchaeota archaeon]
LEQYYVSGHFAEKVDVIIQGGTFNFYPKEYQEYFIKYILKAMNDFSKAFFREGEFDILKFKEFFELPGKLTTDRTQRIHSKILALKHSNDDISHECDNYIDEDDQLFANHPALTFVQTENETSKIRCVGLTIETKPDYGKLKQGNEMLMLGCTRVEIGLQSIYNEVLKYVNRGHTVKDTIESFRIMKDLGFKITAHYMPGLPLTTTEMDVYGLRQLFENQDFRPDMLKI